MLQFYDIDDAYASYLRSFDNKVPNITYDNNSKFVCGVVISINGCEYFAPISSQTINQQTNMIIKDRNNIAIASIKFCFMIPVPRSVITRKNFSAIRGEDPKYADLLQTEYEFCKKHERDIIKKARRVYAIGCNANHVLNSVCCNFCLLEEKCKNYSVA